MAHVYHWKHGWIPLDAYATAIKAKFERGSAHALATKHGAPGHRGHGMEEDKKLNNLVDLKSKSDKLGPHSKASQDYKQALAAHQAEHGGPPKEASAAEKLAAKAQAANQPRSATAAKKADTATRNAPATPATKSAGSNGNKAFTEKLAAKKSATPTPARGTAKEQSPAEKLAALNAAYEAKYGPVNPPKQSSSAEKLADKATRNQAVATKAKPDTPAEKLATKPAGPIRTPSKEIQDASTAGLDESQRDALKTYTGHAYSDINSALRQGYNPGVHSQTIDEMDAALASKPLPESVKVFRTVGTDAFGLDYGEHPESIIGTVFNDKGFMSTAVVNQKFGGGGSDKIHMEMEVPAGVGAAYVAPFSHFPEEKEMVMQRNLRYVVSSVRKGSDGTWHAKVRVLPPAGGGTLKKAA